MTADDNKSQTGPPPPGGFKSGSIADWLRAMAASPGTGGAGLLEPGCVVGGRYRIKGVLGQGGMGIVYLAHDEDLERDVALKIQIRPDLADAKERLAKEAKALARLSHPNVVSVYEVSEYEGQLFIAMEYVEGETLDQWLRRPRKLSEIVAMFVDAGTGLAAAHEVGLVHRDFKPGNVLVGRDGRVRVADFGLALSRAQPQAAGEAAGSDGQAVKADASAGSTFQVMGTPAYMAPEQIRRQPIDARTDQFAFCVALFEAVFGARPFEASTLEELLERIMSGDRRLPAASRRVPGWLARALERGLASDPDQRFGSMAELLDALRAGPRRVRRLWSLAGALAVLGLVAAGAALLVGDGASKVCRGAERRLATAWADADRRALQAAFVKSELVFADKASAAVQAKLDRYGRAWAAEHTQACEATRVYAEQSAEALDLRMACLDRRLNELKAVVGVLSEADAGVIERALELTGSLTDPAVCRDIERLARVVAAPREPKLLELVRTAEASVTRAEVLARAGRLNKAEQILDAIEPEALRGYLPLRAELKYALAGVRRRQAKLDQAEQLYEEAVRLAAAAGHDLLMSRAMADLAYLLASKSAPVERTDSWLELAWAVWSRTGREPGLEAHLAGNTAFARERQGRYPEAVEAARRCVEIRQAAADPLLLASALSSLGMALLSNGEPKPAREVLQRALDLVAGEVGLDHPTAIAAMQNLTGACKAVGDYPSAIRYALRAAEAIERLHGQDAPDLADQWGNLGVLLLEQGDLDKARSYNERSLAITRKIYGPDNAEVAFSLGNLAIQFASEKHYDQAYRYALESREILQRALQPDHPVLVNADCIVGTLERELGKLDDSARTLGRALERADRIFAKGHPGRLNPRVELARTEIARGRLARALRLADEALALAEGDRTPARMRPDVWFVVAEALWAKGRHKDRALDYARKALTAWEALGYKEEVAKATEWLAARSASDARRPESGAGRPDRQD